MAKVFWEIFTTSKRPSATCFSCQLAPKKLIKNANMSCVPFDNQRSKLTIAKLLFAKVGNTHSYLVFSTNLTTFIVNFFLWTKIWLLVMIANIGVSSIDFPQTAWTTNFLKINKPISWRNKILLHMIFLERIFGNKKINNWLWDWYFFGRLSFHFSSQWMIHFLFKYFYNNKMVCIHIFFNVVIPFVVLYMINLSLFEF